MVQLISILESGFPEFRHELSAALCKYHQFQDHLYTVDGVILYKSRTSSPPSLRQHDLTVLHSAHQGVTSMTARAETAVFWPGITATALGPSQPDAQPFPLVSAYPFQCISADFFHYKGKT